MSFLTQPWNLTSVLCLFFLFHVPCLSQRKTSERIPGQVEFSCPEEFGYYPHPNDCTQYYVCVFGGAVLESCTGGLMYSHELQTCDWPRNVGCEGLASASFTDDEPSVQVAPQRRPAPPPPPQQRDPPPRIPARQRERDELVTKPLYEEEELGPAEEIESDRQQRVYRGQPPTLGQVARDRDGIAKHANALQTSSGVKQHVPFNYRASVAPQQNQQQVYLQQQSVSPTPSFNFSSAINQFNQQQRPQQQFDTSYYNLYDDDDFYREDDYAQQFQNQNSNRGKTRDQDVQVSQREQQKKLQQQQQQQNNVFNSAAQDYNEQYNLQSADQDTRYEQPSKSSVLNTSADSIKPNNSSPPRLSFSFEQTPQPPPAAQRSNRFTIPETRSILKPFSFNQETQNSNDRNIFRNFESSLQRENTLPVVQLFQQDKPLRQQIISEKQFQTDRPVRQQFENNERKYQVKPDNFNRNNFENEARQKAEFRNEQRDPKRIGQVRGANDAFVSGFKDLVGNNGNFRIIVDETSSTFRPTSSSEVRKFSPTISTQQPRLFTSRDDTYYQPSKTEYVTKVPQLSQDYSRTFNETIKQRLNSVLVGTAIRGPSDSKQESSTSRFNTFDIKASDLYNNNNEWKPTTQNTLNRGVRPTAAYLVESEKKGEYYLYSSESPRLGSTTKNPFEISTEEIVIVRQTSKPEDNYRQSLPSTNVYTRLTTPNSLNFENKQTAPINTFVRPSTPLPNLDNNFRQPLSQFNKPTIQLPKQTVDVKPWKFNVANKQITSEDGNKQQFSNNKFSTLSQVKSTIPNTQRPSTTPYTPYNFIKQMTTLSNNDVRQSTYRQQIRSTTVVPTSSRDFKDQQIRANQVKVTADRARVLEQNLQRNTNNLNKVVEVNRFFEPTTIRFPTETTLSRFKLSKPAADNIIKDNFVDSVSYPNATGEDEEYYYDDFEEYEEDLPPANKPNPPSPQTFSSPLPPKPISTTTSTTTTTTTARVKQEPVRTQAPPRVDDEKCIGSECNEKPFVRVRPTSSANQSTPIVSSSRGRVRGYSTTTTSPDADIIVTSSRGEKTTSSRSRPTLKPSQSIVSKVSTESVDIYKFPPSRPESVYPTPTPDKTAAKCRKDVCLLPDCYCGGKDIPGDLSVEETPQIVLLTFDDSVNDLNKGLYADLFEKGRTNPNGCPISATFYVSHEWTDYSQVQNLYANGHEMASHTVSHSFGEQFSQKKWTREIAGQREILSAYGGVRLEDIRGMRAPFLAVGGNKMFKMLYDSNFTYDSSMPVYENRPPSWPYTLDYKIFHDCMIPPCPTRSYPGVWEVPMVMWQDLNGGRCSMGDACSNPSDADGVYKMLIKNFERHFTTNRAPFGLYYHAAWFTQPHHKEAFINFMDTIVAMPEVWVVTNWQALQWVRDPTPINRLNSFQPFQCDYPERPKKCNNPKVCNLWHKSGVRYMRTCQPCPDVYPWTGLSGIKGSRVDNEIITES